MAKRRIDTLLVERGLAEDREKARALVIAGQVRAGEQAVPAPSALVDEGAALQLAQRARYVSRGGEKLEHALRHFGLDVSGLVAADVGSSTGGFTDCLLQHGASRVYAIDVGKGQLDYGLRQDPRVVVMEGGNARELEALPEAVDVVTVDVSFISLRLVLPVIAGWLPLRPAAVRLKPDPRENPAAEEEASGSARPTGASGRAGSGPVAIPPANTPHLSPNTSNIVALFKPQFEAERSEVPRGGVVRDPQMHATLIGRFAAWCVGNGLHIVDLTASPNLGADGNREFFFWLRPVSPEVRFQPDAGRASAGNRRRDASPRRLYRGARALTIPRGSGFNPTAGKGRRSQR